MEEKGLVEDYHSHNLATMDDPNILYHKSEVKELGCNTIVLTDSPEDFLLARTTKYYWPTMGASITGAQPGYACVYVSSEAQLGHPEDTVATTTPWPKLQLATEPEPAIWRGVFSPPYKRKVLFSQEVTIRTADLPRWKPKVVIDRRTLDRSDE